MMRKGVPAFVILSLVSTVASAQTLDQIIAKNVAARGGLDKIKAIQSIRMTGKIQLPMGIEAPITIELKRPKRMRADVIVQGMTITQALDGDTGWHVIPMMGKKDPERMSPDDMKEVEDQADLDGPLVDWKAKGHKVELVGKEKVDGSDAWKLKLTKKNGDVDYIYLDADAYLEIKDESKRVVHGDPIEGQSIPGDYKPEGGVMFPHSIDSGVKGKPDQRVKMTFTKIEINPKIEDARFKMPAAPAAAPKK